MQSRPPSCRCRAARTVPSPVPLREAARKDAVQARRIVERRQPLAAAVGGVDSGDAWEK